MNPLPIILLFLIKNSILVLGQHFLLTRHLLVPPIDGLGALSVPLEGGADGIDDAVNSAETLPLAGFLVAGDAPWDFPEETRKERRRRLEHGCSDGGRGRGCREGYQNT